MTSTQLGRLGMSELMKSTPTYVRLESLPKSILTQPPGECKVRQGPSLSIRIIL
jgi:hypothetical protein